MKKYHKNNIQSLFEKENTLSNLSAMGNPLEELVKVIDFEAFRSQIEAVFEKQQRKSNAGRRPFDPVMMFKVLFLQRLYGLSDHQTQYQITDRNSFRVFLGICNVDDVPDEKTIWKYREIFTENNKFDEIFECYLNELKDKGLELNEGKIIDASFVIVPRSRNTREENAEIKKGNGKNLWNGENKKKHKDVDARWTKKNNENFFGYKNHVKVDKKTKLVEKYDITSANVHDSQVATSLISESDKGQQVWMDAGYTDADISSNSYLTVNGTDFVSNQNEQPASFNHEHFTWFLQAGMNLVGISNSTTDHFLRDHSGRIIIDSSGMPITVAEPPADWKHHELPVIHCEAPPHPFYVRWINRFGGWDYWMMACRQIDHFALAETSTYTKYWTDPLTATGDPFAYHKKAKRTIKASTGLCAADELRELCWLPLSPRAEFKTTPEAPWRNLIVSTHDVEIATTQTTGDIEYEFELPTLQLQF